MWLLHYLSAAWLLLSAIEPTTATPIEVQVPESGDAGPELDLRNFQNIDPDFTLDPHFGTDRIKGLHAYMNTVKACQELALLDYNGRQPERDYQYEPWNEVKIHIRGYPTPSIGRKYALWGLLTSIGALSRRPPFVSGHFDLVKAEQIVGTIYYDGPNTPLAAPPINASQPIGNHDSAGPDSSLYTPTNYKRAPPDREGQLELVPWWYEEPVLIRNFFLAAVGGIITAASYDLDAEVKAFVVNIQAFHAQVWVERPEEPTDPPMRYRDAINALVILIERALADNKFNEVGAEVWWTVGDQRNYIGRLWVSNVDGGQV